jgi:hypothetical protein
MNLVEVNESLLNYFSHLGYPCELVRGQFEEVSLIIYELLWPIVQVFLREKDDETKRLRYFLCWRFPDQTNTMKSRLFYCHYTNVRGNLSIIEKLEASLCYNYLM